MGLRARASNPELRSSCYYVCKRSGILSGRVAEPESAEDTGAGAGAGTDDQDHGWYHRLDLLRNCHHRYGWRTSRRAKIVAEMEARTAGKSATAAATTTTHREAGSPSACLGWDHLRRDPELWARHGNCFIHLYGQGQSRRGPAFRLPLSALLAARCQPFIERYVGWPPDDATAPSSDLQQNWETWEAAEPGRRRVDLYVPVMVADQPEETRRRRLATRNLLAWAMGRGLVGHSLGSALVELLTCMDEFRDEGADNLADLVEYADQQGYWGLQGRPDHALAALHLAETYQLRDLYVDAFSHCVGMSAQLVASPEYSQIFPLTKRLLRRARVEADLALSRASSQLSTFLGPDLSEKYLGLSAGARAHLEQFRTFLLGFYSARLGRYPPVSTDARATIWPLEVYRVLRADLEALYGLLVDQGFTSAENTPFLAQGGICAVQSVHSFDLRLQLKSLRHPLPLLPEVLPVQPARRFSWSAASAAMGVGGGGTGGSSSGGTGGGGGGGFGRGDKLRPDERLVAHAALIKATNHRPSILRNRLVQAYRQFEEDMAMARPRPGAVGGDRIGLVDGRKVRWILVYVAYQVIRHVTEPAPEVHDVEGAPYLLSVPVANLPPWEEEGLAGGGGASGAPGTGARSRAPSRLEIKPDIDYMALTQQEPRRVGRRTTSPVGYSAPVSPVKDGPSASPRAWTLTSTFSPAGALRRSLSRFRSSRQRPPPRPTPPTPSLARQPTYREIVVHEYGNGTGAIVAADSAAAAADAADAAAADAARESAAQRSLSTSSNSSAGSTSTRDSYITAHTASSCSSSASASAPAPTSMPAPESLLLCQEGDAAGPGREGRPVSSIESAGSRRRRRSSSLGPTTLRTATAAEAAADGRITLTASPTPTLRRKQRPVSAYYYTVSADSAPPLPTRARRAEGPLLAPLPRPAPSRSRSPSPSGVGMMKTKAAMTTTTAAATATKTSMPAGPSDPGAWTIVSPSLGGGNTVRLEVSTAWRGWGVAREKSLGGRSRPVSMVR